MTRILLAAIALVTAFSAQGAADDFPLANLPFGWSCRTLGDVHYVSGECTDVVSDLRMEFLVGSPQDFHEPCRAEPFAETTQGSLAGVPFCETYIESAVSHSIAAHLSYDPSSDVALSDWFGEADRSAYRVDFWTFDTRWSFIAYVSSECERARIRDLLLAQLRIKLDD